MPDKIRIRTVRIHAGMTALCRTPGPIQGESRPGISRVESLQMRKIVPDLIQAFSGHEESIGVFK